MTISAGCERVGSEEGVVRELGVVNLSSEGKGFRGGTWRYWRRRSNWD